MKISYVFSLQDEHNASYFSICRGQSCLNPTAKLLKTRVRDKIMLRKRSIIESLNDMLKNVALLVHTRHRSFHNFLMNLLAAMGAYCFFAVKPEVNFDFDVAPSNGQLVLWQ